MFAKPSSKMKPGTRSRITVSQQLARTEDTHTLGACVNFTVSVTAAIRFMPLLHSVRVATYLVDVNEIVVIYIVFVLAEGALTPEPLIIDQGFQLSSWIRTISGGNSFMVIQHRGADGSVPFEKHKLQLGTELTVVLFKAGPDWRFPAVVTKNVRDALFTQVVWVNVRPIARMHLTVSFQRNHLQRSFPWLRLVSFSVYEDVVD